MNVVDARLSSTAGEGSVSPLLSIIVPTFNERLNVNELVTRLDAVLQGIPWEVVFVDDDLPDGTADFVRSLSQRDGRVRCIQRVRTARPILGLHRGDSGDLSALRCGYGW